MSCIREVLPPLLRKKVLSFTGDPSRSARKLELRSHQISQVGGADAFVTLVLADGSYGWTYRFGGTGTEEALDLAFDGNQNLYVAGRFASTVNFALEWGGSDSKTPVNASDAFLTKVR